MEREYDYPLAETEIIWNPHDNPELPPVDLVKIPSKYEDDGRYYSSWGACNIEFVEASPDEKVNLLMRQFVCMTAIEGVDPRAVHKAFMQIPEYRCAIANHGYLDRDQV